MKNNLRLLAIALGMGVAMPVLAQKENVGIGTTKPDQSAVLEISSSTKGVLMPRMSLQQRNAIQSPAQGLVVYQTDFLSGFYYFDGKEWKALTNAISDKSVALDPTDWSLNGNDVAGPSVATTSSYIGTPGSVPINFKIGGVTAGKIANSNDFYLGYSSGLTASGGGNNTGLGTSTLRSLTTGYNNVAVGFEALKSNTAGANNIAIGGFSLSSNTAGTGNIALGHAALVLTTTGSSNVAVGADALFTNSSGSQNIAIGRGALVNLTTTNNNIAIGYQAGNSLTTGGANIMIGTQAGYSETGSDKLYISNSSTVTPLVYGDFATKYLAVGEVAAADRAAATSGGYRLLVKGGMITEKIKVAVAGSADWADYVFEPSYKLMSLDKVESFIKENKHLPNVPSAEEMSKNGLDVMQTSAKLMEKIEELTLYMIEMNKEIKALKEENAKLKK